MWEATEKRVDFVPLKNFVISLSPKRNISISSEGLQTLTHLETWTAQRSVGTLGHAGKHARITRLKPIGITKWSGIKNLWQWERSAIITFSRLWLWAVSNFSPSNQTVWYALTAEGPEAFRPLALMFSPATEQLSLGSILRDRWGLQVS